MNNGYDDLLEMQDFDEVSDNHFDDDQLQQEPHLSHQYSGVEVADPQTHDGHHVSSDMVSGSQEMILGGVEDEQEEESVYIKDNVVMRRIQIEGEDQEYLMDPEGNIYDM